jgi:MraZ protein
LTRQVFTGEYRHSVDDKGRIAVPAKFRAQLAEGGWGTNWIDQCLAIFPRPAWDDLSARVRALPVGDRRSRDFQRFLFGGAFEVELDRQGRVVVPAYLREFAGLGAESVVVGSLDHIEIWAPDRWANVRRGLEDPDALAEHIAGLGI